MSHKLIGKRFGLLEVVDIAGSNRQGSRTWICKCECGNETRLSSDHLTRKRNPVTSCGCKIKRRGSYNKLFKGVGDISSHWWKQRFRKTAQRKNGDLMIDLTMEQAWDLYLKQGRRCALSGLEISIGSNNTDHASIDRIDNTIGYTISNIQWVHKDINFMKRIYSVEYFVRMCKLVVERSEI